jgi:protein SHQ1
MVTPVFKLDQDDEFIYIVMILKYAKISNADFDIDGNNFRFYLKPYSLNLTFSGQLKEMSDLNKSSYDVDKQQLTVQIEKMTHGEEFENLDMITSLIAKFPEQKQPQAMEEEKLPTLKTNTDANRPLIEVISSTENEMEDIEFEEEKSRPTIEDMDVKLIKDFTYGFNNLYQDVFQDRKEELHEFAEIDPEAIPQEER